MRPSLPRLGNNQLAYSEKLASRIREILRERDDVTERKMFGGLCIMVSGHMACGPLGNDLMVRVGRDDYEMALEQPFAREMDFTGRPMRSMVFVASEGLESEEALRSWVDRALAFVTSLPPK